MAWLALREFLDNNSSNLLLTTLCQTLTPDEAGTLIEPEAQW